ncbi:hypothetical protein D3C83_74450 [compost metagenome]
MEVSFCAISTRVVGQAMPIRMIAGITVQRISTVVFSWNCAALWPFDLRCA